MVGPGENGGSSGKQKNISGYHWLVTNLAKWSLCNIFLFWDKKNAYLLSCRYMDEKTNIMENDATPSRQLSWRKTALSKETKCTCHF